MAVNTTHAISVRVFHTFFLSKHSGIEKAFLFDVVSKIYIATDR